MQDRFLKILLIVVAGLLAANLVKTSNSADVVPMPSFLSSAQAQVAAPVSEPSRKYQVNSLKGFSVEDLQDIVAVGDGRSFVVSNSKGFMVYQVVPSR